MSGTVTAAAAEPDLTAPVLSVANLQQLRSEVVTVLASALGGAYAAAEAAGPVEALFIEAEAAALAKLSKREA